MVDIWWFFVVNGCCGHICRPMDGMGMGYIGYLNGFVNETTG